MSDEQMKLPLPAHAGGLFTADQMRAYGAACAAAAIARCHPFKPDTFTPADVTKAVGIAKEFAKQREVQEMLDAVSAAPSNAEVVENALRLIDFYGSSRWHAGYDKNAGDEDGHRGFEQEAQEFRQAIISLLQTHLTGEKK